MSNLKSLKLPDEEFGNVQREMEGISYKVGIRISRVCNDGHEGQYCICGEYSEPIHVEALSTPLDGRERYHEVFEVHFRLQIMPRTQEYCLERIV
jgi:hypothetical protein